MVDIDEITGFMTTHARLLDRRRAELALGRGDADAVMAALAAYRNPDGGFGWALEPDMRTPAGQPIGALHALEVLEDIAPATSPLAAEACDWLARNALPGGALPFALAGAGGAGSAPMWASADPTVPSLLLTAALAGSAHRLARHDRAVAEHPWLRDATGYCIERIAALDEAPHAIELRFILRLLETQPEARAELERLAAFLPASATVPVEGGAPGEAMRPLDFSPYPGGPLRSLLDPEAIERDLDRLEAAQDADGGWHVDWVTWSPAGALEWRGDATVRAIRILLANGRVS
jgi:hypothetical protein